MYRSATHTQIMTTFRIPSLLVLSLLAPLGSAGTLFVDANSNSGANDGSSWGNAFQGNDGLQAALAVALAGDQVWVADGTYIPSQTGTRTDSFKMSSNVEVYGGFNGSEMSLAQRVLGVTPSILSGDLAGDDTGGGNNSENSHHLIKGAGADATGIFDGFTVTAGNANSNAGNNNDRGGGIIIAGVSSGTIRNCHFVGNRCTFGGGAGYINGDAPSFINTTFENNSGGSFGGAFDIANAGAVTFESCRFIGNNANRAGALEIFATSGVVVTNCFFKGNTATGSGGGGAIWMGSGGNTRIVNCTVVENSATNQTNAGLRVQGAAPVVVNSIFYDNSGPGGAQNAANQIGGTTDVTYCIVEGGFAGVGNLGSDPMFQNPGGDDYTPGSGSPAIDAGNNGMVTPGVLTDLAGNNRFVDDPGVADTGVGGAPLTDIGALEAQQAFPVTAYCFGDGSGTACPCSNAGAAGNGCANSAFGGGSNLSATGIGSVSADSLTLHATMSSPGRPGIFFQGELQQGGGAGSVFGDGLRCAGGPVVRLELIFADAMGNANSTLPVGATGGVSAGNTRRYQWWYRDAIWGSCDGAFNVSNGIELVWIP